MRERQRWDRIGLAQSIGVAALTLLATSCGPKSGSATPGPATPPGPSPIARPGPILGDPSASDAETPAAGTPAAGTATPPAPAGPRSTAARDVSGVEGSLSFTLPTPRRRVATLRGRVRAMHPPTGRAGLEAWSRIELEGAATETFHVLTEPRDIGLPFAVGEVITAVIDCTVGGRHALCDGSVRDEHGELLMIASGSGRSPLEGLSARASATGRSAGSGEQIHGLEIERGGRAVTTRPAVWTTLAAADGIWLVGGEARRWTGTRPPGAIDHQRFHAVRLRIGLE